MIEIITPEQFKTVAWKNGKGETIEIAINETGSLDDFDWRLSMASVVEDGIFSNFSGYTRNLILISGDGINLQHNDNKIDKLSNILDIATFDGGNKTIGNLHADEITDFNVITKTSLFDTEVITEQELIDYPLKSSGLCFIFSLDSNVELNIAKENERINLPAQHLMKITDTKENIVELSGQNLIIVYLTVRKN